MSPAENHKTGCSSASDFRSSSPLSVRTILARAGEIGPMFKILGNMNRLKILIFLQERARSVGEIQTILKIQQPTLSQQLGELREARLIIARRVAKSVIYELTAGGRHIVLLVVQAISSDSLDIQGRVRLAGEPHRRDSTPAALFAVVGHPRRSYESSKDPES